MVVNDNNPKIWASLIAPNPDDVTYWVDLTADPHGNIIKFYDNNDEQWYNLTSPTSEYATYPYIGPNGNWFIENRDSGIRAQGDVPDATINGYKIADNPVLTKEDIGLGNVANLAPEDYPVPDAVYGLIDGKVDETRTINGHTLDTDVVITKGDIGLGNVENIAPADMPISTATATALSGKTDSTRNIVAGSGLTGGGNLTADRTINVASATDGIIVNADNIQLNTNNTLTSTSTTQALSAAQGKVLNDKNIEQDAALLERPIMIDPTGDVITPSLGAYSKDEADAKFVAKTQVVQTEGTSTINVMSQKAVTDELTALETDLNELELKVYGNEAQEIDITSIIIDRTINAFFNSDGVITLSSVYRTAQPYLLKKGHTITADVYNASHITFGLSGSSSDINFGDIITPVIATYPPYVPKTYTAENDVYIVISGSVFNNIKESIPELIGDIESLNSEMNSIYSEITDVVVKNGEQDTLISSLNDEIYGKGGPVDITNIFTSPDRIGAAIEADGLLSLSSAYKTTQPYLLKAGHSIWLKGNPGTKKALASTVTQFVKVGDVVSPLNPITDISGYAKYTTTNDIYIVICGASYTSIIDIEVYTDGIIDHLQEGQASSSVPNIGNLDVAYPEFDYNHIITYGQSFSEGGGGVGKYDIISGNYMIGTNVQITDKLNRSFLSGLASNSNGAIATQCTNAFSLMWRRYKNKNTKFIASAGGHSGATLSGLLKDSYYYSQFLDELTAAKIIANAEGKTIGCIAIMFIQGESGGGSGVSTKSGYKYLMDTLKNDMQADIMSIYGQSSKPIFITYQTGYKWINNTNGLVPQAQLEYAIDNDDVLLGCPSYCAAFTDTNHPSGNGYAIIGELMAKYMYSALADGKRLQSIYPYKITAESHSICIYCNVTNPPLVVDTHTVKSIPDYGFVVKADGTITTIKSIIVSGNYIKMLIDEDLTGKIVEVTYAVATATDCRGNICDSDTKYISYQTYGEELETETMQDAPIDINGRALYGKRLPLQNWLGNFNINESLHFYTHNVRANVGESFINALYNKLNFGVAFTSSSPAVATISSDGTISAVASGNAIITATIVKDGISYSDEYLLIVE